MTLPASRLPLLPLTLMALLIGGCRESTITSPSRQLSVSTHLMVAELPFHFSGNAVLLTQLFAPGFPATGGDFDGRCSVPSHFLISFAMTGQTTHLGDVTALLEHCTQLDPQTGLSSISDGEMVVTAANGDELRTSYQKAWGGQEVHVFTGGTGRFVDASGEAVAQAECDRAAGTCVVEMDGVIVYSASDRGR